MTTIAPTQFTGLIVAIRQAHPALEMQLSDANAKELEACLLGGELDACVYALPGKEPNERGHAIVP